MIVCIMQMTGCESLRYIQDVHETTQDIKERMDLGPEIEFSHELHIDEIQSMKKEILSKDLTLESAIQLCLIGNATLKAYYEELGIGRAELLKAKTLRNPRVHAEILESQIDDEFFVFPNGNRIQTQKGRDQQFHFSVVMDLMDVILKPDRIQISKAKLDLLKIRVSEKIMDVIAELVEGIYIFKGESQKAAVMQQIYESVQSQLELALEQHKAGNSSDLFLVQKQIHYQNTKMALAEQNWNVKVAREKLNKLMGLWAEDIHWKLDPTLESPGDIQTAFSEESDEQILKNNLQIKAAKFELNILRRTLSLERKEIIPELEAGFARDAGDGHVPASGGTFGLEIPIFDRNQGEVYQVKALIRKKERELEALAVDLRSEMRLLQDKFEELKDKINYYKSTILPTKKRHVELALLHYNGMFLGAYDVLDVKASELEAKRDWVDVLKNYWVTRSKLEYALAGGHVGEIHNMESLPITEIQESRGHGH